MEREKYSLVQTQILALAAIVKDMPLKEFIAAADKADAVGPIFDPTLWLNGHNRLNAIRDMAGGLLKFQSIANDYAELK